MTKKDYILTANVFKPFYQRHDDTGDMGSKILAEADEATTVDIIMAMSKALAKDNPRFNPVRFLDMIRDNTAEVDRDWNRSQKDKSMELDND